MKMKINLYEFDILDFLIMYRQFTWQLNMYYDHTNGRGNYQQS